MNRSSLQYIRRYFSKYTHRVDDSETNSYAPQTRSATNSFSDHPKTQIGAVLEAVKDAAKRKTIYLFARSTREKEQWFHQ